MRLFLIRHGETVWNAEGRFQGQIDTDLNATGLKQADTVAERLKGHPFSAVFATPLSRAHVTANMIASRCGMTKDVECIQEFTEINHGDWEGLLATEVAERWPDLLKNWHTTPHLVKMPGENGEDLEMLSTRVIEGIKSLKNRFGVQDDICLVSHDAVIKVILCHYLGAPLSSFWRFQVGNCSLSIIDFRERDKAKIPLFGDVSFLNASFEIAEQKGL